MGTLVLVAAPYCYGPTSKLLCVAEDLAATHDLVYAGDEPGLGLAKNTFFSKLLTVVDRDRWSAEAIHVLTRADLLVSFLDYRALRIAESYGIPSVFVDTLLWLRQTPLPHTDSVLSYIAQGFFHSLKNSTDGWQPRQLVTVGPILPRVLDGTVRSATRSRELRVLVNFGGLRSPVMLEGADVDYVSMVLRLLKEVTTNDVSVRVCLPAYLRGVFPTQDRTSSRPMTIEFPGRLEFYDSLKNCDLLLTVPGLEAVLEALSIHVPVAFLPPYNATQFHQVQTYRELGVPLFSLWPRYLAEHSVDVDLTIQTKLIQQALRRSDLQGRNDLARDLRNGLDRISVTPSLLDESARRGTTLLRMLGESGRSATVRIIEEVVASKRVAADRITDVHTFAAIR